MPSSDFYQGAACGFGLAIVAEIADKILRGGKNLPLVYAELTGPQLAELQKSGALKGTIFENIIGSQDPNEGLTIA